MIRGIGIDIVDISRVSDKVADKILSQKEYFEFKEYLDKNRTRALEFLAGRLAAKEAYLKATGVGLYNGISLKDLDVAKDSNGAPYFKNNTNCFLSISHDAGVAVAVVVIY